MPHMRGGLCHKFGTTQATSGPLVSKQSARAPRELCQIATLYRTGPCEIFPNNDARVWVATDCRPRGHGSRGVAEWIIQEDPGLKTNASKADELHECVGRPEERMDSKIGPCTIRLCGGR